METSTKDTLDRVRWKVMAVCGLWQGIFILASSKMVSSTARVELSTGTAMGGTRAISVTIKRNQNIPYIAT